MEQRIINKTRSIGKSEHPTMIIYVSTPKAKTASLQRLWESGLQLRTAGNERVLPGK